MRVAHAACAAVATAAMLGCMGIVAAYAEPIPVAPVADGTGGFAVFGTVLNIAIHDMSNRTYAVVASEIDDGVQVIDISDPADPLPTAAITDDAGGFTKLNGATSITIHDMSNRTYGVVASWADSGVQIIDITSPDKPVLVAVISDDADGFTELNGASSVAIHDTPNGTYALVAS